MPKHLGKRQQTGRLDANNPVLAGGWTVQFTPADIGVNVECEVYHISVRGPGGSNFQLFLDTVFYDNVVRGDINSWDPSQPMYVQPGTTIYFYYNSAAAPAPVITCFFREISPL